MGLTGVVPDAKYCMHGIGIDIRVIIGIGVGIVIGVAIGTEIGIGVEWYCTWLGEHCLDGRRVHGSWADEYFVR